MNLIRWLAYAAATGCLVFLLGGISKAAAVDEALQLEITAPSAILMDAQTGRVLYAKGADVRREPASVTKIMTLALTMRALREGRISLTDMVTASPYATSFGGSQIWLEPGEQMSVKDLIYAVAVGSANDGSVALAEHIAGSEDQFLTQMNLLARELGLKDSHFANPHGLPAANHFVSARDMATLSRYLVTRYPEVLAYTSQWEYFLREDKEKKLWLVNTNRGLKNYQGMDGLKTGWTSSAGFNLVATAKRDNTRLIGVVMGSDNSQTRFQEMYKMLDAGFNRFETVPIVNAGEEVATIRMLDAVQQQLSVVASENLAVTIAKGESDSLQRRLELPEQMAAPVEKGSRLGRIVITQGERIVGQVDLVAAENIARAPVWQLFFRFASLIWPLGR